MRVVKLGGSLLDMPAWPDALRGWLRVQSSATNLLVVGGGARADSVRALDRQSGLPPAEAHWMAIRAMQYNAAAIVATALPESRIVRRLTDVEAIRGERGSFVADPWTMLREEPLLAGLPQSWDATSDSIAARLAMVLDAQELVLLKSCPPPGLHTPDRWSAAGYVDVYFPKAIAGFGGVIRAVDLRSSEWAEAILEFA